MLELHLFVLQSAETQHEQNTHACGCIFEVKQNANGSAANAAALKKRTLVAVKTVPNSACTFTIHTLIHAGILVRSRNELPPIRMAPSSSPSPAPWSIRGPAPALALRPCRPPPAVAAEPSAATAFPAAEEAAAEGGGGTTDWVIPGASRTANLAVALRERLPAPPALSAGGWEEEGDGFFPMMME